jgi:hypothetical protein
MDEEEDAFLRPFSATFVEYGRKCYNNIPDKGIKTWEDFDNVFMKTWGTKGDPNLLLLQLCEMKKKESDTIKKYDTIIEKLLRRIPNDIRPKTTSLTFFYVNTYKG